MRNAIVTAFVIVGCFLLQCSVLSRIAIGSITPNLIVILAVSMGLLRGSKFGMWTGFFAGLMIDLFYGSLFGFYALIYMYIGYFAGKGYRIYYDDDIRVPLYMTALGDTACGICIYGLQFLLRGRVHFMVYLTRIILPEMFYTVLLTLVVYRVFHFVNYHLLHTASSERESYWILK